jgi:hypothetical protein
VRNNSNTENNYILYFLIVFKLELFVCFLLNLIGKVVGFTWANIKQYLHTVYKTLLLIIMFHHIIV